MTGGEAPNGVPTANGVAMALSTIHIPGFTITTNQQDDAVNGVHSAAAGSANISTLVADRRVLFVVGPYTSGVAVAEIPVSNAAGLMQCSPSTTYPGLTKTWGGIDPKSLRPTRPDQIAYVRVATTDDVQGEAGADIAYNLLGKRSAYVLDDGQAYGTGIADAFVTAFTALGGKVVKRDVLPVETSKYAGLLAKAKSLRPGVVYYAGLTTGAGGLLRKLMVANGMGSVPFIGADAIIDGSATTPSSFLNIAGPVGDRSTYGTIAATHDIPNADQFAADYRSMFNIDPGPYSAAAYACTQLFLQALGAVGSGVTDLAQLRAGIRAYLADPGRSYVTALGTFSFDSNGDTSQHIISYYQFDRSAADWTFAGQRDLRP